MYRCGFQPRLDCAVLDTVRPAAVLVAASQPAYSLAKLRRSATSATPTPMATFTQSQGMA